MVNAVPPKRTMRIGGQSIRGLRAVRSIASQTADGVWTVRRWNWVAESKQTTPFGTSLATSANCCYRQQHKLAAPEFESIPARLAP